MRCSVFIATSVDGYIASKDGGVDWLASAGDQSADMSINPDLGFNQFISTVDCMIMGRKCMEVIAAMNLTAQQWPYGELPIYVLSKSVTSAPASMHGKVRIHAGDIPSLLNKLTEQGLQHAYVDGGATITSFINLQLINEMTITKAPILLGDGIPLFGKLTKHITLKNAQASSYPNGFIQEKYQLHYR